MYCSSTPVVKARLRPESNQTHVRYYFHGLIIYQVHKVERENKKLLKMWNATRARLLEAERADWSGEGDQPAPHMSTSSKGLKGQENLVERGAGRRSGTRARRPTKKGATPTNSGTGKEKRQMVPAAPEMLLLKVCGFSRKKGTVQAYGVFSIGRIETKRPWGGARDITFKTVSLKQAWTCSASTNPNESD